MANNLIETYKGIFNSSKEILKKRQRHLYLNMLDILIRTLKTPNVSGQKDILTDDYIKVFAIEILQLLFDDDKNIQENAIIATDIFITNLDLKKLHNLPEWEQIRTTIVENYVEKIHNIRNSLNSNWYKIWCQLVKILDFEILKFSSIINKFLKVVEAGFRSDNYEIRSEAFLCWKVLIEIHAKYNELSSFKRIKLLCIPLKSAQSRTLEASVSKYKVWWYFICKLNPSKLEEYSEIILEPFLTFCFDNKTLQSSSSNASANIKSYPIIKQMAIACFIEMLGYHHLNDDSDDIICNSEDTQFTSNNMNSHQKSYNEIRRILETKGLEIPNGDEMITAKLISKSSKSIFITAFEATILILEHSYSTIKCLKILWKSLHEKILKIDNSFPIYSEFIEQFYHFLIKSNLIHDKKMLTLCCSEIIELFILNENFPFNKISKQEEKIFYDENLTNFLKKFTTIIMHNIILPSANNQKIIRNIFNLQKYQSYIKTYCEFIVNQMKIFLSDEQQLLTNNNDDDDVNEHILRLQATFTIWYTLTEHIIIYLNKFENIFEFRKIDANIEILQKWILWPLNKINASKNLIENCNENIINHVFTFWTNCVLIAVKLVEKGEFLKFISTQLKIIYMTADDSTTASLIKIQKFHEIIITLISCLDTSFELSQKPIECFDLIKFFIGQFSSTATNNNKVIKSLVNYIKNLGEDQIIDAFDDIIGILLAVTRVREEKNAISKCFEDEIKRTFSELLKTSNKAKEKKLFNKYKNAMKKDDEFVIIPKVWSLNPDKLTEHQKEKMKEKRADIPALYNDISQSQDTGNVSIKPWTPNKIVIAKVMDSEIAIVNENNIETNILATEEIENFNHINCKPSSSSSASVSKISNVDAHHELITTENVLKNQSSPSHSMHAKQNNATEVIVNGNCNSESVLKTQRSPIKLKQKTLKTQQQQEKDHQYEKTNTNKNSIDHNNHNNGDCNDEQRQVIAAENVDQVLNTINVQIENEEKRRKLIKELKSIEIDTIEGNVIVSTKLRRRTSNDVNPETTVQEKSSSKRCSLQTIKDSEDDTSSNDSKRRKRGIKSKTTKSQSDNVTKISSKIARKSLTFEKNKEPSIITEKSNETPEVVVDKNSTSKQSEVNQSKDHDSSLEDVIGSSQQCESVFTKRFLLRKSMTSNQTIVSPASKKIEENVATVSSVLHNKTNDTNIRENIELTVATNNANIEPITSNKSYEESLNVQKISKPETELADVSTNNKTCNNTNEINTVPYNVPTKPITSEKVVSENIHEADTELNTEIVNDSKNNSSDNLSDSSPPQKQIQQQQQQHANESPDLITSPIILSKFNNSESFSKTPNSLNKSNIMSSPELENINDRTAEFLNNTLNISPISSTSNTISSFSENESQKTNIEINSNQINNGTLKTLSPTEKKSSKGNNSLQLSPPDRKAISTTSSPAVKPKVMASQLMGRGAQFLNLIRNKRTEVTPKIQTVEIQIGQIKEIEQNSPPKQNDIGIVNKNSVVINSNVVTASPSARDLLTFSKNLPPADASPSASILKRKLNKESYEEYESPLAKRKRVSFHDPPVSTTKEYVKDSDETCLSPINPQTIRCLSVESTSTQQQFSKKFHRISRADSLISLAKYSKDLTIKNDVDKIKSPPTATITSSDLTTDIVSVQTTLTEMRPLNWNSINGTNENLNNTSVNLPINMDADKQQLPLLITNNEDEHNNQINENEATNLQSISTTALTFADEQSIFDHIFKTHSIDTILEKYVESGKNLTNKSCKILLNEMSKLMVQDTKLKTNILETLSESYPVEFLDHAIQENLNSVVCEKLNSNSIIEYVCEKSKLNGNVRKFLLERVQNILEFDKMHLDCHDFILSLLKHFKMTETEKLEFIQVIVNANQMTNDSTSNNV